MEEKYFTIDDEIYPENLKNIYDPPKKIYYIGNIELLKNEKMISIVGTRKNSSYGALVCDTIVKQLIQEDVLIVSGFALGIDTIAHKTCIANNGKTIAIIASGLDIVYPASNLNLWKAISEKGLILSEYPFGIKPYRANFPKRNRIIAGLSKATIVVESKEKGGSLITANIALDENRDVFAIPSSIFSENSKGCNNLIKESKAKLLNSAQDILEEYNWKSSKKNIGDNEDFQNFSKNQKKILELLSVEKTLDTLVRELELEASLVLSEIMELEILGLIKGLPGGKYIKIF